MNDTQTSPSTDAVSAVTAALTTRFRERLDELLNGMPAGEPTWITTGGPAGGLNGSVADLSAEQASREVAGTTVAAHIEHVRWALRMVNDYFAGADGPPPNWSESWSVRSVDGPAWDALRAALKAEGDSLLRNVATAHDWTDDFAANGALTTFGHLAYHLGAVRQLRKLVL